MPIKFKCVCGKLYQVKDEHAGKVLACKHCGKKVRIPGGPAPARPAPQQPPPPAQEPQAPPAPPQEAPPPTPTPPAPKAKAPAGAGGSKRLALAMVAIAVAVVALVLAGAAILKNQRTSPWATQGAGLMPADTVFFMSVPDLKASRERFKQTALYAMSQDPALKGITDPIKALVAKGVDGLKAQVAKGTDFTLDELVDLVSSGASLGVFMPDNFKGKEPPPVLAVVRAPDPAKIEELISQVGKRMKLKAGKYEEQGETVKTLDKLHYLQIGDVYVVSDSKQAIQTAIRLNKAGGEGSLAEDPNYKATRGRMGDSAGDGFGFVNVAGIVAAAKKAGGLPPQVAAAAGLDSLGALSYGMSIGNRGFTDTAYLYAPAPKKGFVAALSPDALSEDVLAQGPADAQMFAASRLNLPLIYDTIKQTVTAANPQAGAQWSQAVAMGSQMLKVDIEKGLLPAFGDNYVVYGAAAQAMGPMAISMPVVMIAVKDKSKLQPALGMLEMMVAAKMKPPRRSASKSKPSAWQQTDYNGQAIRSISIPMPSPVPLSPSYALTDTHLVIALSPQGVQGALDRLASPGESITSNPDFQNAAGMLSKGYGAVSYSDTRKGAAQMMQTLPMAMMFLGPKLANMGIQLNMQEFPKPDAVAKHLFGSAAIVKGEKDGIVMESFSPFGGVAPAGVAAALLLPALSRARSHAPAGAAAGLTPWGLVRQRRQALVAVCKSNLKQIGRGIARYSNDHQEKYPPKIEDLYKDYITAPQLFICPEDKNPLAIGKGLKCSYRYVGQLSVLTDPAVIIAYDKRGNHRGGRNALHYDGSVQWVPERAFLRQLQESLKRVKKAGWQKYPPKAQAEIEAFYSDALKP